MERVDLPQMPSDVLGQVLMHLHRLRMEIQSAKNLVNGKPIDADRKLQGVLTRCDNLISDMNTVRSSDQLADKSDEACADGA